MLSFLSARSYKLDHGWIKSAQNPLFVEREKFNYARPTKHTHARIRKHYYYYIARASCIPYTNLISKSFFVGLFRAVSLHFSAFCRPVAMYLTLPFRVTTRDLSLVDTLISCQLTTHFLYISFFTSLPSRIIAGIKFEQQCHTSVFAHDR